MYEEYNSWFRGGKSVHISLSEVWYDPSLVALYHHLVIEEAFASQYDEFETRQQLCDLFFVANALHELDVKNAFDAKGHLNIYAQNRQISYYTNASYSLELEGKKFFTKMKPSRFAIDFLRYGLAKGFFSNRSQLLHILSCLGFEKLQRAFLSVSKLKFHKYDRDRFPFQMKVNIVDHAGRTPLHLLGVGFWFRMNKLIESVQHIKNGRNVYGSSASSGELFLEYVIDRNSFKMGKSLLLHSDVDRIAEVSRVDHSGRTPVHYAALYDATYLCRLLVEAGGDSKKHIFHRDNDGFKPIELALKGCSANTLKFLIGRNGGEPLPDYYYEISNSTFPEVWFEEIHPLKSINLIPKLVERLGSEMSKSVYGYGKRWSYVRSLVSDLPVQYLEKNDKECIDYIKTTSHWQTSAPIASTHTTNDSESSSDVEMTGVSDDESSDEGPSMPRLCAKKGLFAKARNKVVTSLEVSSMAERTVVDCNQTM